MKNRKQFGAWLLLCAALGLALSLQAADELTNSIAQLKQMPLEDLMNQQVFMVARGPELLSESPSAIQVIRSEDIRRSGATTLAEALRLAPNLQVAQQNAHDWAISARGFNGAPLENNGLANKLLVMIDGRSVYTPLFGGVFWDVQQVLLEDVDHIEVVSGPGASLWGDNAVNGVINVVTKSARDTQGLYVTAGAGSFLQDMAAVRYGGSFGTNLFYRVYVQRWDHDPSTTNGVTANDRWAMTQGGFRFDYYASAADLLTFQGDFYENFEGHSPNANLDGENVLARWTRTISEGNEFSIETYFDRTWRELPTMGNFADELKTYDIDFQHRFGLGTRQNITWGGDYRLWDDHAQNTTALSFTPGHRQLQLFGGFVQDEVALIEDRLKLTVGTKLEHNDYSDLELEPSGRLAWLISRHQTLWAAISRATRSPTRFDVDERTPFLATLNGSFDAEKETSYELGYRVRPHEFLSLSLAGFYNTYDDLRSVDFNPNPLPLLVFANHQSAESYGFELSGDFRPADWWRLRGGYSYTEVAIHADSPSVFPGSASIESVDPHHQFTLQSILDLPHNIQFDAVARYVSRLPGTVLPSPSVPEYFTFDVRLAWTFKKVEIALIGQNLAQPAHREFGTHEIPRSVFGKVSFRF